MKLLAPVVLALAVVPQVSHAAAAQILFAVGRVEIERAGVVLVATRGAAVEVGDKISTGPTGFTQLRFADGALMSLRQGSAMQVEEYKLPTAMPVAKAPSLLLAAPRPAPTGDGGTAALRLLRGAFRTITGIIGKSPIDSYKVVTPAATIGIRGTDYTAAYCETGCGSSEEGLYVGVSSGAVDVQNEQGTLALGNDEYGYVKDTNTPPQQETTPPPALETPIEVKGESEENKDDGSSPGATTEQKSGEESAAGSSDGSSDSSSGGDSSSGSSESASSGESSGTSSSGSSGSSESSGSDWGGSSVDSSSGSSGSSSSSPPPSTTTTSTASSSSTSSPTGTSGSSSTPPPVTTYQLQPGIPGQYAFAHSSLNGSSNNGVYLDSNNDKFTGFLKNQFVTIESAQNLNTGSDGATQLKWGRWSGGSASNGGAALNLSQSSLHWIYALAQNTPVIPVTGTASYRLIGNTNPTDTAGNVGFLGSATLSANFSNQTVSSSVNLGINSQSINATGSGNLNGALFSGAYSSVTVNGGSPTGNSGAFNGFMTNNAAAAGLGYTLNAGGSTVSGVAAFERSGP